MSLDHDETSNRFFDGHGARQFAVWRQALEAALQTTPWIVDGFDEGGDGAPTVRLRLQTPASGRSDGV